MKLIRKIDSLYILILSKLKLIKIKLINSSNILISHNSNFKSTSRLKVWSSGKIVIGKNFSIGYNSEIYSWDDELIIGNNTSINDNCKIYGDVKIGSNCLFASNIFISSGSHNYNVDPYLPIKVQDSLKKNVKRIVIEDDCWIGFGVVIMQGVYVGKGAIIGSNTVVTKDILPYSINVGIPNRQISNRLEFNKRFNRIYCNNKEHWPYFYKGINYKQFQNIDDITKGIEVEECNSVFLIAKNSNQKLTLSGFCNKKMEFEIQLNDNLYSKITVNKGEFEELIQLENQYQAYPDYIYYSEEIKKHFNIITIKNIKNNFQVSNLIDNWLIKSIGYYED